MPPRVSIILVVRNGMPHLRDAVESVRALTYRDFELVVQDGASDDGTLEFLRSVDGVPEMSIRSEPDTGIGQGFNRAVQRCRGEIVGSIDADNRLRQNAIEIALRGFAQHPEAAVVYCACDMIDGSGRRLHAWTPPEFDLLGLMDGSVVPPFATSFFSRERCGAELRFDEEFRTVADFDLWLRLSHLKIVRVLDVVADVRVGDHSSTWNAANYDNQTGFKVRALQKLLGGPGRERVLEKVFERAEAGIYLWAVDSMDVIAGGQERIDRYFGRATGADLRSERFRDVLARARPRLPASDPTLGLRLLQCGIEYIDRCKADVALVYFEYLHDVGFQPPELAGWLERAKSDRWNTQTQSEVAVHLQDEVNRRDRIIDEKNSWWSNEVCVRDAIINDLRRERDWMLSGWRRFVVRRKPA